MVAVEVQEGRERRLVVGWRGLGRKDKDKEELLSQVRASDDEWRQAARQRPHTFPAGPFLLRAPGLRYITLVPWRGSSGANFQHWLDWTCKQLQIKRIPLVAAEMIY